MSSDRLSSVKSSDVPVKRAGGIKVVVKSKKNKAKRKFGANTTTSTRGLPKRAPQDDTSPATMQKVESGETSFEKEDEDIPCDTLLALRSLEQKRQCLDVPLFVGTVPCVLESQLEHLLQSQNGEDSVVTVELQQLSQFNQVRRFMSPDHGETPVAAVMETRHYKRAVWDAHRHYNGAPAQVTAGFLSCLHHVTKRRIPESDLRQHWPGTWNDAIMDTLVKMQVLLPLKSSYILWLPHWGLVLKQLSKAQMKVIQQLKRSLYKELSKSQVERLHHTGLSGQFVLHTLVAQGFVELQERPSGTFVRLTKST